MKKTTLLILIDSDNRNLVYPAAVAAIKAEIRKYFGTRSCQPDDPTLPFVKLNCEVVQEDINFIKKILDNDSVYLTAMVGLEGSKCVNGDIIDFTIIGNEE